MSTPHNSINAPAPSRRSFITKAAAMSAGVALGATGSLSPASAGVSPALTALIARMAEAREAHDEASDRHDDAIVEIRARCPLPKPFDADLARALGEPELEAHYQASVAALRAAKDAVLAFPAATVADCREKLQFSIDVGIVDGRPLEVVEFIIADLDRISGVAGNALVGGV
jgi:hypothetical protein